MSAEKIFNCCDARPARAAESIAPLNVHTPRCNAGIPFIATYATDHFISKKPNRIQSSISALGYVTWSGAKLTAATPIRSQVKFINTASLLP